MLTRPRSCLYRGWLQHRRFTPRYHAFRYRLWMAWLDLDELPELFDGVPGFSARRPALVRFRRADYLSPETPCLKEAVRAELQRQLGEAPEGRICLLTQLRTLGVGFNPISLYYAYDAEDRLCAVLGEVTNTPWGERTHYACRVNPERHGHRAAFLKAMHVSPFLPMEMEYQWRFNTPGEALELHMDILQDARRHFDATLSLSAMPATRRHLLATLARHPGMPLKTLAGIHFEALRLWLKRIPWYSRPTHEETPP
ncbi:DUF1365 domain-containing protein [Halomonas almeriensis]|uniref:DUF1365 domain-containing protein n=1 Tax=Halomonas almeriensis TaxID=308163 RepID=UPI0025B2A273|nr:DUF1365 domain-containing protein [Halomonas almeriensis]MDN3553232.1 DUF1365 domain-containing protein [Halomonas almeriensis]